MQHKPQDRPEVLRHSVVTSETVRGARPRGFVLIIGHSVGLRSGFQLAGANQMSLANDNLITNVGIPIATQVTMWHFFWR